MRYPLPWFPLSDDSMRCISCTIIDCRPYRSSHVGCRFCRSGSSRFVGGFRLRHWCGCVPAPKVRSCRDRYRYRYRYICCPSQYVSNDGLVFAVVERPFFTEVVATLEHFAVVVVAHQFLTIEGDRSEAVRRRRERRFSRGRLKVGFQTTSKKIVRSSLHNLDSK